MLSSSAPLADRAVVYTRNGAPSDVLRVLSYPPLTSPPPNAINMRILLAPVNPADINVIEGVYPTQPIRTDALAPSGLGSKEDPVFVGGNEGLGQVTAVGEGVRSLVVGDWVLVARQQAGTWATHKTVAVADVMKIPQAERLTEAQGATLTVNPPTAYNMLADFVDLKPGDWVVQNGANSAVGQAVVQIARVRGLKTINLIRNRKNVDRLKTYLQSLGATYVLTYDELAEKSTLGKIKQWTAGQPILLGLNCIGGKETTMMARLLGIDSHLVSYGAMSKQPLTLPTSLFIFKNLTSHGFWQSRWYSKKSSAERESLMQTLVTLMVEGKLNSPEHDIVKIGRGESDQAATEKIKSVMIRINEGTSGKKILLKFET